MFPLIKTLSDVLPFIEGNENFIHIVKEGYSVIDYVSVVGATFPTKEQDPNWSIFRECRGLIFDESGNLISRPLRKAMNYGERPSEDAAANWSSVTTTIKRDGSMIRPILLNGNWRLATRKGVTDVAMLAETYLIREGLWEKYVSFFNGLQNAEPMNGYPAGPWTPVFEFTSRDNRIVLDYPEDSLTLLAIRNNYTGQYLDYTTVRMNSHYRAGIPHVSTFDWPEGMGYAAWHHKLAHIRGLKEAEGVVVQFHDTQEMVKIKAEDYCNLHRIKSYIDNERSVVACLVNDQLDDLIPLLSPTQLVRVNEYADQFWKGFHETKVQLWEYILAGREWATDKRTFAVEYVNKLPGEYRPLLFWLNNNNRLLDFDCHELLDFLKGQIKYANQSQVENSRWIHGAKW